MVTDANALKDAEINGQTLVFALFKRTLQPIGVPDGWTYDDGVFSDDADIEGDADMETVSSLTTSEMFDRGMEFSGDIGDLPCVLEEWELDKVFATRELAEQHVAYHAKKARTPFEEGHKIEPVPLCSGPKLSAVPSTELVKACNDFRDSVLHGRHQLQELCLDNDQTNAVLGLFDDTIGECMEQAQQKSPG